MDLTALDALVLMIGIIVVYAASVLIGIVVLLMILGEIE